MCPSIDLAAALMLPESLARRYKALPIRFLDDGCVLIVVADPTNVMFSDELRLAVGMPVRICVAAPDAIEAAILKLNDDASVSIEEVATDAAESEDNASVLDLNHDTPSVVFINRASRRPWISAPPTSTSPPRRSVCTCVFVLTAYARAHRRFPARRSPPS